MTDFTGTPDSAQDLDDPIRATLSKVLHNICKRKNREQVCRELTARLGRPISVAMLNDFTRPSKRGARFPAAWIPAFCEVTEDESLLHLIAGDGFGGAERMAHSRQLRTLAKVARGLAGQLSDLADSRSAGASSGVRRRKKIAKTSGDEDRG